MRERCGETKRHERGRVRRGEKTRLGGGGWGRGL